MMGEVFIRECGTARAAGRQGAGVQGRQMDFYMDSYAPGRGEGYHVSNILVCGGTMVRLDMVKVITDYFFYTVCDFLRATR